MKIFITTDWHFGIYLNNLDKWLNMMEDYFYNFFIPYIKKNVEKGDILIHCGDLYDNRTSIPIIVSYKAEKIIHELSRILPVHIIVGNHDLWSKGTNDINSVRLFNYMDNVKVYTNPTYIDILDKRIVLIPWVEKKSDMIKEIKAHPGDYLFCHSDLNGCKMHLNSVAHRNTDKIDVDEFKSYKHVFSGHIHIRQNINNFTFIGSPYQMDRNDMGNQKGITTLNLTTNQIHFEPNNYSPIFKKIIIKEEKDIELLDVLKNSKDYIDIYISNKLLINNRKLRRKLEIYLENNNFSSIEYIDDLKNEDNGDSEKTNKINIEKEINENINIDITLNLDYEDYIKNYIQRCNYDENVKNGILKEYEEIIKIYKNNYIFNKD